MPSPSSTAAAPRCIGNPLFHVDEVVNDAERHKQALDLLSANNLYHASRVLFGLPDPDTYTYHATASVQLAQAQRAVAYGPANGLHAWYHSDNDSPLNRPSQADIEAYISIFSPLTSTLSALKNFGTNAKKGSLRSLVARRLDEKRYIDAALRERLTLPKCKKAPWNPYFDFWAWSCRNLEWCGPCEASDAVSTSHHILPVFMHHFGCVTPSHEALEVLKILAHRRPVVDVGSGNGYWSFMLRRYGLTVHSIDNMQSVWRVVWIGDTMVADGVEWLVQKAKGGEGMVLLLVYPVVGSGPVDGLFTRNLLKAFKGDTLAVVGTQNSNGFTGFRDMTMDAFMARHHGHEWTKVVQIALPSFAAKDEALFIFERRGTAASCHD
ncbi:hypothetical protein CDD81_3059 [Ophiocordyceps australis]|uniref:Methyltransferase domain-containing protein n=1 Tax=Ophiocordyceps australis TaxID=1399860 RepID=A0A2C5YCK4_9HYPO|nr:hypothetical protein CDD81_3059 [Ophiocordyceps australis]